MNRNHNSAKNMTGRVAGVLLTVSVLMTGSGSLMLLRGCSSADTGKTTTASASQTAGSTGTGQGASAAASSVQQADPAKAQTLYEEAFAYEKGGNVDYSRLKTMYEEAVSSGSARAMTRLGYLHQNGYFGKRDADTAKQYYEQAIEAGDAGGAYYGLGSLHEAAQDNMKALEYYRKGAEEGNGDALGNLGRFCYYGMAGLERSDAEALQYYEQAAAAEEGAGWNASAGWMYLYGTGVEKDAGRAAECFQKAADAGSADGFYGLYICSLYGQGMTQDKAQAVRYLEEAYAHNPLHSNAMYALSDHYFRGDGVNADTARGLEILETGASMQNPDAFIYLGIVYRDGDYVQRDTGKALAYYEQANDVSPYSADGYIAYIYAEENGVPMDTEKAGALLEEAYRNLPEDDIDVVYNLAGFYLSYSKEEGAAEKAFSLLSEAHEKRPYNTSVTIRLGSCYRDGNGTAQDFAKAMELYEEAKAYGSLDAYSYIAWMYYNGNGVAQDTAHARQLWEEALAIYPDHSLTLYQLGESYFREEDFETALSYFEKTKELGYCTYLVNIGNVYRRMGEYGKAKEAYEYAVEKNTGYYGGNARYGLASVYWLEEFQDYEKAYDLCKQAADYLPGNTNAMVEYAATRYKGERVEKNDEEAFRYAKMAADRGSAEGYYWLGACYMGGIGTEQDNELAKEYLLKAKEAGAQYNDIDELLQRLQ